MHHWAIILLILGEAFYGVGSSSREVTDGGLGVVLKWKPLRTHRFLRGFLQTNCSQLEIQDFIMVQLLNSQGMWNETLVKTSFLESDVKEILNIPISPLVKDDEIIWDIDPKKVFQVKSAYRLGIQLQTSLEASASNSYFKESLWKSFWKAQIPTKIKICGWKIYNDTPYSF